MTDHWNFPYFASFAAIAIALAIICLPMIHKFPEKNAKNLAVLLASVLTIFAFLVLSLIIISKIIPDFNFSNKNFSQQTFLIYSILSALIIALAISQVGEYVVASMSCYALIFAAIIISTAYQVYENLSTLYLIIIVAASLLIDLLVHLNSRSRINIKTQITSNYSNRALLISPLNTFVVITVSAAKHIEQYNLSHDYLLLVASVCAAGLIPSFSFWRSSIFSYPKTIFVTLVFFQSSIIAKIFFSINFQAMISNNPYMTSIGKIAFFILIIYAFIISLNPHNSLSKNVKILIAISLASAALLLSEKPSLSNNISIIFVLIITTFSIIFHQNHTNHLFLSNYSLFVVMICSVFSSTLIAILTNYNSLIDNFLSNLNNYKNLQILSSPLLTIISIMTLASITSFRTSKFLSKYKNNKIINQQKTILSTQIKEQYIIITLIGITQIFCIIILSSYI